MSDLTPDQYRAVLRQDFCSFVERCFYELNPSTEFHTNWHLEVIAAKLDAIRRGELRRLIIMVPPRHLKSICASVALPAWILGHDPSQQIICASYAQDLAEKLARDSRTIMLSPMFRSLFPRAALAGGKQSVQEFTTKLHGYRLATSVGGVLTGRGADVIIIDDPLKPDEALSDTRRGAVNDWFDHTLYSRLNDKRAGAIVVIMQRLHEDDLVGHVLEQEDWDVVRLPAIAEEEQAFDITTPLTCRRVVRQQGSILHAQREPAETLQRIRNTIGEYNFAGQYQQAPSPLGGGMVKSNWFGTFDLDAPPAFDRIIQSWDTANKSTELSDYSVCTTWGVKKQKAYLMNVLRQRLEYPALKRAVRDQRCLYNASVVLIEDKASGTQLIQELGWEGMHQITRYSPELDKIMRLHAQTGMIEGGFVHLPAKAPWLDVYLHELTTFPAAKHDDQTDSTSQFLDWFKRAINRRGARFVNIDFMGR